MVIRGWKLGTAGRAGRKKMGFCSAPSTGGVSKSVRQERVGEFPLVDGKKSSVGSKMLQDDEKSPDMGKSRYEKSGVKRFYTRIPCLRTRSRVRYAQDTHSTPKGNSGSRTVGIGGRASTLVVVAASIKRHGARRDEIGCRTRCHRTLDTVFYTYASIGYAWGFDDRFDKT
jgi:hypothetical protein